jgi:hypothetical protein
MGIWNQRERSAKEIEFTRRAVEKISEEGKFLLEDIERNDVKFSGAQLILELEYVIKALVDPFCSWNEKKSDVVLEYYTLKAELYNLPFLNYIATPIIPINLNQSLTIFKTEIITYVTNVYNESQGLTLETYDSIEIAYQSLGPGRRFYYSQENFDGVPSPRGSLIAVTKEIIP